MYAAVCEQWVMSMKTHATHTQTRHREREGGREEERKRGRGRGIEIERERERERTYSGEQAAFVELRAQPVLQLLGEVHDDRVVLGDLDLRDHGQVVLLQAVHQVGRPLTVAHKYRPKGVPLSLVVLKMQHSNQIKTPNNK